MTLNAGAKTTTPTLSAKPVLRLARLHLRSVGPSDARLDPLDLRFESDRSAVAQRALMELTNTGGKSTIITLAYSVLVPRATQQMGRAKLGEYVLKGDTSHVAMEWESDDGQRFVTGAVYEWPGRTPASSGGTGSLNRAWYFFRSNEVGIDDLPFDDGTSRRRMTEFRSQLDQLTSRHSGSLYAWATDQREWAGILDTRTPIDPELVTYQMRMNDNEGGAGHLTKTLTNEAAFIRFFVGALNDEGALEEFSRNLDSYATLAGSRQDLELERDFCASIVERLGELAGAQAAWARATEAVNGSAALGAELATGLQARIAEDALRIDALSEQIEVAAAERDPLLQEIRRFEDFRSQLNLEQARFRLADVEAEVERLGDERNGAKDDWEAWRAVPTLTKWVKARSAVETARSVYEEKEAGLAPLRAKRQAAGASLAAKYAALADEAETKMAKADEEARLAADDAEHAKRDRDRHSERAHRLEAELGDINQLERRAQGGRARLRDEGHAEPGEKAADAVARWEDSAEQLDAHRRSVDAQAERARAEITQLTTRRNELAGALQTQRERVTTMETQELSYRADLAAINAMEEAQEALDGDLIDSEHARRAISELDEAAGVAEQTADEARRRLGEVRRELDPLESGSTLATAADIEAVCAHLNDAGIGALTAWSWLAQRGDAARADALITAHPEIANSVVLSDPGRIGAAKVALESLGVAPRMAVLVSGADIDALGTDPVESGFVVSPHRALYDEDWRTATIAELREELARLTERSESATRAAKAARRMVVELESFVGRWPEDAYGALCAELRATQSTLAGTEQAHADNEARLSATTEHHETLTAEAGRARDEHHAAQTHALHAGEVAKLEAEYSAAVLRRPGITQRLEEARAAGVEAGEELRTAEERNIEARLTSYQAAAEGEGYRVKQGEVGVEPASVVPAAALSELTAAYDALEKSLRDEEAGSDHATRLQQAEEYCADARADVDRLGSALEVAGTERLGTFDASNPMLIAAATRRAEERHGAAQTALSKAEARRGAAQALYDGRLPKDGRSIHVLLPEEWAPSDADSATELLGRVDELLDGHRARRDELGIAIDRLQGERDTVESARSSFEQTAGNWIVEDEATVAVPAFIGTPSDAQAQMRELQVAHRQAAQRQEAAKDARVSAHGRVTSEANKSKWDTLTAPIRERCRIGLLDDLAVNAAAYVVELESRTRSLADDLEDLDRHRSMLVDKLVNLCKSQRRMLREVTASSMLPEGLGELSGQSAFKITFDTVPEAEARGKLAARVDLWANGSAASNKERTDRLAEALADTVRHRERSGPWTVQVLKPSVDYTPAYRSPDRIDVEFSGGQELTLAVLLYLTLSRVRAHNRTTGQRPPMPLILDNPFGAASNPALIKIQQSLAERSDVQLLCATGLTDASVITAFEGENGRILFLRNDKDQRRALRYLRIRDERDGEIKAKLGTGRDPEDPANYLSAATYRIITPPAASTGAQGPQP